MELVGMLFVGSILNTDLVGLGFQYYTLAATPVNHTDDRAVKMNVADKGRFMFCRLAV